MSYPLIVDAHQDIAFGALAYHRDFRSSVLEKRAKEGERPQGGLATLGLAEALRGNVRVIFSTLYAAPADAQGRYPGRSYSTPQEAEQLALEQLNYYRMLAQDSRIALITSQTDLERLVSSPEPMLGLVLLMEGADPIVRPEDARNWFALGVRIVGPAWHRTRYSGGTGAPGPLTDLGRLLMTELGRAGFILDTSHMSDESFFEALDIFEGHVIASHSNARTLVPTDRQLSDAMIRALVARDGVIGTVFCNQFLRDGWRESGALKEQVTLDTIVDEMKYICDLAGDALHVGIGSDFDGGFGAESIPYEMDTVADLQLVGHALSAANFKDDDVECILGGNWLRLLRGALPS
jgi:membrane dipeptidase